MARSETLRERLDGWYSNSHELFAVVMKRATGTRDDGTKYFRFRPSLTGPATEVEWHPDDPFALYPKHIAYALVAYRFAEKADAELVETYNAALDATTSKATAEKTADTAVKPAAADTPQPAAETAGAPAEKAAESGEESPGKMGGKTAAPWEK